MFRFFGQYVPVKSVILVFSEMFLIVSSLYIAFWLRFRQAADVNAYIGQEFFAFKVSTILAVCFICFYYNDLYDLNIVARRWELMIRLAQALGAACLVLALLYLIFPDLMLGRGVFALAAAIGAFTLITWRMVLDYTGSFFHPEQRVLVVGTGAVGVDVVHEILAHEDLNFKVVGFLTENQTDNRTQIGDSEVIGSVDELERVVAEKKIERVILSFAERRGQMPLRQLLGLKMSGTHIEDAHTLFEKLSGRILLNQLSPSWLILSDGFRKTRTQRLMKRATDMTIASIGLVLTAPVMVLVSLAIVIESGFPVFFRQPRTGYKGRHFNMLKFRSMRQDSEKDGAKWAHQGDARITRVGKIIRKYRLDEIPQFINVIRGEMSIVGPRPEQPLLAQMLEEKIPYYSERHNVRPGITGWAQIRYRYGASIEETERKLEYDLFYIKHMSPMFDLAIAFRTVQVMFFGHGAV